MMESIPNGILALDWRYEIARNEPSALVNKLIECVLPICARFSPNNWPGGLLHALAISVQENILIISKLCQKTA